MHFSTSFTLLATFTSIVSALPMRAARESRGGLQELAEMIKIHEMNPNSLGNQIDRARRARMVVDPKIVAEKRSHLPAWIMARRNRWASTASPTNTVSSDSKEDDLILTSESAPLRIVEDLPEMLVFEENAEPEPKPKKVTKKSIKFIARKRSLHESEHSDSEHDPEHESDVSLFAPLEEIGNDFEVIPTVEGFAYTRKNHSSSPNFYVETI